ncbi:MAG: hypothetical protein HYY16_02145 [Planctomycetes bacterium]|nr:hypothetical protein [Planctomycetota bacterium]
MKRVNEFIFVRCSDKKTAQAVKAARPPSLMAFDCDGEQIAVHAIKDEDDILRAMDKTLEQYSNKEITWGTLSEEALAEAKDQEKLVVLFWGDDKKESEEAAKMLEDRVVAKYHDKVVFLKAAYVSGSPEAKLWGTNACPMVMLIDPAKEAGGKAVVEKLSGKQKAMALKNMLVKGLAKASRRE